MFFEYPRPGLKRNSFFNLNGEWLLNGQKINVPYPPESALSLFKGTIGEKLNYEKRFILPSEMALSLQDGKRCILHFGAVDQVAKIFVDKAFVGTHEGGYLPFSFDITDFLIEGSEHLIEVEATDALLHYYPYGKQCKESHGMWYTQVSGIWQTVWAEIVPKTYISNLRILPTVLKTTKKLDLSVEIQGAKKYGDFLCEVVIPIEKSKSDAITKRFLPGEKIEITFSDKDGFEAWDTENPKLYDFTINLYDKNGKIDEVQSYFALRSIRIDTENGAPHFLLNEKPIFLNAVLDQGYFSDGIFLPENENAYENDIKMLKSLGFNALRKHIKVESEVFYYYCDRLGILVMQDMVQNGDYSFFKDGVLATIGKKQCSKHQKSSEKLSDREKFFIEHTKNTIRHLYNHPSIVYWTIFNEGWGQFATDNLYNIVKGEDASRIIDSASGWFKGGASDVESDHIYFKVVKLDKRLKECAQKRKPLVISECGGFSLKVKEHNSSTKKSYGYGECATSEELAEKITSLYSTMIKPYTEKGLCGVVYTQLSDVENEINGLCTYDRKVCKVHGDFSVKSN